jgi:HPt (histidine-containing phosphotransfer) domain-containing protein
MASESRPAPISGLAAKEVLLANMAGDVGLLSEVLDLFLEHAPKAMTELRAAVTRQDAAAVAHWGHTLKGMVANFENGRAFEAAGQMETLGGAGDIAGATTVLPEIEMEMSALLPAVLKVRSELA